MDLLRHLVRCLILDFLSYRKYQISFHRGSSPIFFLECTNKGLCNALWWGGTICPILLCCLLLLTHYTLCYSGICVEVLLQRPFDRIRGCQRLIGLSSCPQRTWRYATCAIRCMKGPQFEMEKLTIWWKKIFNCRHVSIIKIRLIAVKKMPCNNLLNENLYAQDTWRHFSPERSEWKTPAHSTSYVILIT